MFAIERSNKCRTKNSTSNFKDAETENFDIRLRKKIFASKSTTLASSAYQLCKNSTFCIEKKRNRNFLPTSTNRKSCEKSHRYRLHCKKKIFCFKVYVSRSCCISALQRFGTLVRITKSQVPSFKSSRTLPKTMPKRYEFF